MDERSLLAGLHSITPPPPPHLHSHAAQLSAGDIALTLQSLARRMLGLQSWPLSANLVQLGATSLSMVHLVNQFEAELCLRLPPPPPAMSALPGLVERVMEGTLGEVVDYVLDKMVAPERHSPPHLASATQKRAREDHPDDGSSCIGGDIARKIHHEESVVAFWRRGHHVRAGR